jgi:hypothetical protein
VLGHSSCGATAMEYGRRSLVTGSSTSCPVLEKPMLAVACCVNNDVYDAAGFNCSPVLQVADSYPLSASRARTNEELALLGAALIG